MATSLRPSPLREPAHDEWANLCDAVEVTVDMNDAQPMESRRSLTRSHSSTLGQELATATSTCSPPSSGVFDDGFDSDADDACCWSSTTP